jgi:two-component sensor histidine kinase/ligand-binding sensor domain-containing protein
MRKYILPILILGVSAQMFSQKVIELQKGKELKLTFQKIEKPVQVFPKIVKRQVQAQKFENAYGNPKFGNPKIVNLEVKDNNVRNYELPQKHPAKFIIKEFKPDFVKGFESLIFKDISLENIKYTDVAHGSFSNQISSITEDSIRVIYLGSLDNGVALFSGKKMKVFNTNSNLPSNQVNFVLYDTKDRLWVATPVGICYIFKGQLHLPEKNEHFFGYTETIVEDSNGNIWFCTRKNGAIKYNGDFFEMHNSLTGLTCDNVKNVLVLDDETWFAYDSNGFSRHTSDKIFRYFNNNNILTSALTFLADKGNSIWIGFFGHDLLRFKDGLFYEYPLFKNHHERIFDIKENSQGLWFSLYQKGLLNLKNNKYTLYDNESGLSIKNVYRTHIDKNENIWIAHLSNGLSRLGINIFSCSPSESFKMHTTRGYMANKEEGLWFLPDGGGLAKVGKNNFTSYTIKSNLKNIWFKHSYSGAFDHADNLWLATEGHGILKINNKNANFHVFDNSGNRISNVELASDSSIWFGFYNDGLVHYHNECFFLYDSVKNLQATDITAIETVNHNSTWVGTFEKGITIIKGDSIAMLNNSTLLSSNQINSIFEDRQQRIWIGTSDCIQLIDKNIIYSLGIESDFAFNNTNYFVQDAFDMIWAVGADGILRFEFIEDEKVKLKYYNTTYGLNINDFEKAGIALSNGDLYFSANAKVVKYTFENENRKILPPNIFIEKLIFEDTTISKIDTGTIYQLKAGVSFEIEFNTIDWGYENTLKHKYFYEKDGTQSSFFELNNQQNIVFQDLPYGKYVVTIIASDINNHKSTISLKFEVSPFWWQTVFFKIAMVILILLTILFIFYLRMRVLKAIQKQLEKEVAEKTKELFEENQLKDVLINEINHRVKNNLQTISSLIYFKLKGMKEDSGINTLKNIRLKIDSMALIHELLYSKENLTRLSLKEFISNLVLNMGRLATNDTINPQISLELEDVKLNANKFIVLGMLTTEILTNSLKHAFDDCPSPAIKLVLFEKNAYINYQISDNGMGFNPNEVDKNSLGGRLIDIFSRQLNAEYTISSKNGTSYVFKIPLE